MSLAKKRSNHSHKFRGYHASYLSTKSCYAFSRRSCLLSGKDLDLW